MIVIKCLMIWFIVIEASSEEIRSTSELSISNAKSTSTPVTLPPPPPQVGGPPPPPGLTGPPPPGITGGPTPPPPLTSGSAPAGKKNQLITFINFFISILKNISFE